MNFQDADQFNAIHGNQFIADLMPKHPIYLAMLTEAARAAIGLPHPTGRAAMRMLENEGFVHDGYIDIFDGGPTMRARTDDIRSVRDARDITVSAVGEAHAPRTIVAAGRLGDFRAAWGRVDDDGRLDSDGAAALGVTAGERIMVAPQ